MSLENIYYIGQTVAVLAILVSLIFLWVQGRQDQKQIAQANAIAQAELSKGSTDFFLGLIAEFSATPEDSALMHKALYTMEPLEPHELDLFASRMTAVFATAFGSFELFQQGLMSGKTYDEGSAFVRSFLVWPRVRKYWSVRRLLIEDKADVVAEFDKLAAEALALPKITPRELFGLNEQLIEDAG